MDESLNQAPPVYMDHAASTPLRPRTWEVMGQARELAGNPSAQHGAGRAARAVIEDAREHLAALAGAEPDEVWFTSGGSEANSIALLASATHRAPKRSRVVISGIEHPSVSTVTEALGERVRVAGVEPSGHIDPQRWADQLDETVAVSSLIWVNNEIGTIQPIDRAAEAAHRVGAWFHTDAVQAFGSIPVNFSGSGADLMSVSSHKLGGPVGIGALIVRRGVDLSPWGLGGRQEGGVRSGTPSVMLAAGFASAASIATIEFETRSKRLLAFRHVITAAASACGGRVIGAFPVSPGIISLVFDGVVGSDVTFVLDQMGIQVSTGSACRAGVTGPSEVLLAIGQDEAAASAVVRISLGWSTRREDVDRLIAALPTAVERARAVPRN